MATSSVSPYRANDPYEILISQMIEIESEPKYRLQDQRFEAERRKMVMSDVDSKISALHSILEKLNDTLSTPFAARSVNLGGATAFSATASDTAAYGSHTLKVERLAKSDARISSQHTASGSSLRTFFDANGGAQSFTIRVASPTDADPNNRVDIAVSVTPTGTTDKEILGEISTAINDAMDQAVTAGTIKSTEAAGASVVNETSTTTRLSLRSGQTGYANRLEFVDSGAGLLAALEITNNAVATGTGGGQVTAVGTSETDSELNSKFVLDGLTLYRNTNQVTDAIDGLTLDLKQVMTDPAEFGVEPGADSIKKEVEDFIAKYNDVLRFIATKSNIDKETKTRGDLANDYTFTSLRFGMRNDVAEKVTGQPAGGPAFLSDLGIEAADDGTLSLKDSSKLLEAIKRDNGAVQSFFSGADGIAKRLENRVDLFVGTGGIMKQREKSMEDTLKRIDNQIKSWDDRLGVRETQLRQQFAKLQEAITLMQGQQRNLAAFFGGAF